MPPSEIIALAPISRAAGPFRAQLIWLSSDVCFRRDKEHLSRGCFSHCGERLSGVTGSHGALPLHTSHIREGVVADACAYM